MKRPLWLLIFTSCCMALQAQHTLDGCQALARENYPLIKRYGLINKSTEYSVANAAKAYLPQVSLAIQATYQSDAAAFPGQMTEIYEQFGIDLKGLNRDQYKVALEVNQTIWDGGLTGAQKDISAKEGNVSARTVETELYALRERINRLYFGILILDEQLRQNELLRHLLQSNCQTVEACVRNGVALPGDLHAIKAELLSVSQQRIYLESSAGAYRRMLSMMTGKAISDADTFEKPAVTDGSNPGRADLPFADITDGGGGNRPELQLLEAQVAQFEARKRMIMASTRPRLGVFAQGFYGNPGLNLFKDMTGDKWSWNYIAGLRMQWNFGAFYTQKGDMRKLSLAQQQVDNQREVFLFNNGLQQIQQQSAVETMRRIMAGDHEIISLRTAIRKSSEAKFAGGTITVNELLRDITAESRAMLDRSLHELEWLKNIYELKYTVNSD
ncbi:MAG: TolC family protein [Tannerella sp.]|jgi:outer membrane protein TolC|nr:TolC family protein [Tannerella sp.]